MKHTLQLNEVKQQLIKIREGESVHTQLTQVQVLANCLLYLIDYLETKNIAAH